MEGQEDGVDLVLTPEQEAQEDAAFEAAFNTARGSAPHGEGLTLENDANGEPLVSGEKNEQDSEAQAAAQAAAEAEAEANAAAQAQAAADAEANAPVTVTKAELDALRAVAGQVTQLQQEMERSNNKTFGHIGSLKQTLEAVKAQAQAGIRPTLNQLTRLEGEFPEMAKLLREDLADAFGNGQPAPADVTHQLDDEAGASGAQAPGAAADVDPLADPRVQKVLKDKEMSIVDVVHPGWRDMSKTPEFQEWRSNLPVAAQQVLGSTWDSKVMTDAFNDFKSWNSKRVAVADANRQRDKRLENAVPATRGKPSGTNAVDEDAAFLAGFKSASGGR